MGKKLKKHEFYFTLGIMHYMIKLNYTIMNELIHFI